MDSWVREKTERQKKQEQQQQILDFQKEWEKKNPDLVGYPSSEGTVTTDPPIFNTDESFQDLCPAKRILLEIIHKFAKW